MYDYASLPTLVPVMDRILGYLSVKERIKAKSVCRSWKEEIERRERKRDTLVLHLGPYPWNIRWTHTNNQRLMKFENSFEVKNLDILKHPMTRSLLNKTKKLAILHSYGILNSTIEPYVRYFQHCIEEIEIRGLWIKGTLTFDILKLRVLVLNDSVVDKLVLNCPSLEVLFRNQIMKELHFQSAKKLKRLTCFGWPETVSSNGKVLESLAYLNLSLFTDQNERVSDRLLDLMPNLKRFVLHSRDLETDLETIRRQQKRLGLKNLEILPSGFRDPVEVAPNRDAHAVKFNDEWIEKLFENYSRLEESSLWEFPINYSKLFDKFKILPSNFFDHFRERFMIEISTVTNYTHLFSFLKCCPYIEDLYINLNSKVDADLILCQMMPLLHPSLKQVAIVGECSSDDVLKIDLAFLRLFNLTTLRLKSTRIPGDFVRKVAARRGPHLKGIRFAESTTDHWIVIYFKSQDLELVDYSCGSVLQFDSLEKLLSHMQSDPHLRSFLL